VGVECEDKEHKHGAPMINIDLDHIVELQDGGAKLERGNVLLRCRSCHVRKTALAKSQRSEREYWERRIRNKGGGSEKIPEIDC
jgi:5-methylcytosine-specific restriction endonuclease McrA